MTFCHRAALRLFRGIHYRLIIFALLIVAIVFAAACISEVKVTWNERIGEGIVVLRHEMDSSQLTAEFRHMRFSLWKHISVVDPTPDKKVPVVMALHCAFGRSNRTEVNPKDQRFRNGTRNSCSSGSLGWNRDSWEMCIVTPELFVSWLRWQFLDLKGTNYIDCICSTIVLKICQKIPIMHVSAIRVLQPEIFKVLERNEGSLNRSKGLATDLVGVTHGRELARINTSYFDPDGEKSYFHDELVSRHSLPKRLGVVVGTLTFIWGCWVLRCGRDDISSRTAILAIIAVISGFILAFRTT